MAFTASNYYFSGQGVVMLASRDANGNPMGLRPLGNVSALAISIATTVVDHKGSQDGQRAIDARLQTETKPSLSMTIENFNVENLTAALRGQGSTIEAATQTGEAVNLYPGFVTGFEFINISELVLTAGETPLVPYTNPTTPYDYTLNGPAGSVMLNNRATVGFSGLGLVATAITVGATTAITVPNSAAIGDSVYLQGFTGADAATVNGQTATVTAASATAISVSINTTGKVITVAAGSKVVDLNAAIPALASYSYSSQTLTGALTQPLTNIWMRFEGLNTANDNDPVIVEVFKFSTDPLKELALISDNYGQFVLEGELLSDSTKVSGSQYFRVKMLN